MEPEVSIVIPVYNVAPFIIRCLQSIVDQTYHHIECILIDDCSTDESMYIVYQFINRYRGDINFHIFNHQKNIGLSAARNTGIKSATGDYIFFVDSDDAITSDCIEVLIELANKYPEADYVQGNIVTGTKELMEGNIDQDVPEFCNKKQQLEEIILCKTHRTAWNRLIKRSFLTNNSLFFPTGLLMEDHYWTYYIAKFAHAVAFTHKRTYFYYNNNNSLVNSTSKASLIKRYSSYIAVSNTIISDMLQRDDIQQCHRTYVCEALAFCMANLVRLHSLYHWLIFWRFIWDTAWKVRKRFTWKRLLFFFYMMPPLCFMIAIKGWRWRLRQYIAWKV